MSAIQYSGTIETLIADKYGFIKSNSHSHNIFFHYSDLNCQDDWDEYLMEDLPVTFTVEFSKRHNKIQAKAVGVDSTKLSAFEKMIPMYCYECGASYTKYDSIMGECPCCDASS